MTIAASPVVTRAAVWHGGDCIVVENLPVAAVQAGEVLVRVRLATVCGSDRHTVSGRRPSPCPSVLGHEAVGEIVELGTGGACAIGGSPLHVGQRVVWSVTLGCGQCDRCRSGVSAKCRTLRKSGHEPLNSGWPLSGGYAEHVLLPAGLAVAIVPDELPDAFAAPAACATATVMAVVDRAGPLAGRRTLVVGAGMLGLTACASASRDAAAEVIAVDPDAGRRELALRCGATVTLASVDEAAEVDVVLEFSGVSTAVEAALGRLDVQGVAVLAGSVAPGAPVALDAEAVVRRHLSIAGVHNYEPWHLTQAIDFLLATCQSVPWQELVADPLPLDDLPGLLTGPAGPKPRYSVAP
ncbi:zinc-binding dehydrogenase [uncultured Jatrophihabitans sp.]|uniref:zinc-binding dehydrogenase n=1 Tax=uncultured Jatrophihabitans sp. TaxID=1610747 RepID=UPI0035C9C53A